MSHSATVRTFFRTTLILASAFSGLALATGSASGDAVPDVTKIVAPWPPPLNPKDSPFAKFPCTSYATFRVSGSNTIPLWGDSNPQDFGPRQVKFDQTGVRALNQIPAPGIHPRIFCTPADKEDIRKRIKSTICGQEVWKNLLCYTNFLKGVYDPAADYAKVPEPLAATGQKDRVPFGRLESGPNQAAVAARYKALIKGDLSQKTNGLWHAFSLEAFRCWIDDDTAAAHDLAAAVTTALKVDQARRAEVDPKSKTAPLEQPISGIQLAYIYDFIYNWLTPEQRKAVHDEIAAATWNHDNYGTFNDATLNRSNWATFSYWLIETLAIEGEPGFNDLKVRGTYRGWRNLMTYGWFPSGANYEGEAKNQLGGDGILALALRTKAYGFDNLAGHPNVRANVMNFTPKSLIPTRDGFVKYDLLGGCHGRPNSSDLLALKYLVPGNGAIDLAYRAAVGEHYENVPNRAEAGAYDAIKWGSYFNAMIPFLVFAIDFDSANNDPSKLGIDNTFFCGDRALMMTRSSWDTNALMLNLHVRQANGGHPFADRNSIMVAGAGRVWAPIYGWGINGWKNVSNGEVLVDDHPQADHTPGRMVDFIDKPLATFAVGDAKYAWDWNWRFNETWGVLGRYTKEDVTNGTVKLEPTWELEQHTVNDFSYTKHSDPFLNEPLALQPDWLRMKGCITPIARQVNYPVKTAFRTAGIVRGPHPYALVLDDIQKDDTGHDYTWNLPLEYDIQIAKVEKNGEHGLDLILTGNDPKQAKAGTGGSSQSGGTLPALRETAAPIPAGQPMLLIRFLNLNTDPKAVPATEAKAPTILQVSSDGYHGRYTQQVRRLAVPVHTVNPRFKVLIYPYRQGDPLPTTTWTSKNLVTVEWPNQKDTVEFSEAPTGKTDIKLTRGAETLVTVNKAIAPLLEPVKK